MEEKALGCVITDVNKDRIQLKEIQSGDKFSIVTEGAKAYSPGDLVTIDSESMTIVDRMEEYPFV